MDDDVAVRAAELFAILSDATRVKLLAILDAHTEMTVKALAIHLDMTESAISHQLRTLRQTRMVRVRKDGRNAFYAIEDEHITNLLRQGIQHIEHE